MDLAVLEKALWHDCEKARTIWEQDWMPKEDDYIKTHLPRESADLFVNGAMPYLPMVNPNE